MDGPALATKVLAGCGCAVVTWLLGKMLFWFYKLLARVALVVIPVVCGVVAFLVVPPKAPQGAEEMAPLAATLGVVIVAGAVASVGCYVYAAIHRLEKHVRQGTAD